MPCGLPGPSTSPAACGDPFTQRVLAVQAAKEAKEAAAAEAAAAGAAAAGAAAAEAAAVEAPALRKHNGETEEERALRKSEKKARRKAEKAAAAAATAAAAAGRQSNTVTVEFAETHGSIGLVFGGRKEGIAPYIRKIVPGSLAAERPALRPGLILVAVQRESVETHSYQQALDAIAAASRPVELAFRLGASMEEEAAAAAPDEVRAEAYNPWQGRAPTEEPSSEVSHGLQLQSILRTSAAAVC